MRQATVDFIFTAVQVVYSARNHLSNTKKTLAKIIPLTASVPTSFPPQELGEVVSYTISPTFKLRANLRETKEGGSTKRFVEIWSGDRIDVSFEVTDYHQAFYLDGAPKATVAAFFILMYLEPRKSVYLDVFSF